MSCRMILLNAESTLAKSTDKEVFACDLTNLAKSVAIGIKVDEDKMIK